MSSPRNPTTPIRVTLLRRNIGNLGGIEKYTLRTAEAFAQQNCQVTLLTTGEVKEQPPHLKIISLAPKSRFSLFNLWQFNRQCKKWIEENPADILFSMDRTLCHTHCRAGDGAHNAYLKRRSQQEGFLKKVSFLLNPLHRYLLSIEKEGYESQQLRRLFTNSEMVRQEILKSYSLPAEKISVVHNGVEWHEMEKDFEAWPNHYDTKEERFHLLFIGHGFKRKGLRELFKGLSLLKDHPWKLSVVGKEKKKADFLREADSLGIAKQVTFYDAQKNIRSFYQKADALIIPSHYDPFANVTVEALAMGLFVVSSRHNGGHEVLTPENGEVITDLFDPISLRKALLESFQHKKTEASARKIRNSIKHLDFSLQLKKMINLTLQS